jgi:hypothetical protein
MNPQPRHPLHSALLLSLTFALVLAHVPPPAQAAQLAAAASGTATATIADPSPFTGWLGTLSARLARWLPLGWQANPGRPEGSARQVRPRGESGPAGTGRPAERQHHGGRGWWLSDCGGQVDPNGVCH